MTAVDQRLRENDERVRGRIDAACRRCGRDPATVHLVAVTKYAELAWVRQLLALGVRILGESRPQQLIERAAEFDADMEWHLIGHLQRNKVRPVLTHAALIHSVDSLRLLQRIDQLAGEMQLRPRVLLEVNVTGEESKDGFAPLELWDAWRAIAALSNVRIEGLMTMAALVDDPEAARPAFQRLRLIRDELQRLAPGRPLPELSMGMSNDFEIAIEEGASYVRIGSLLFEGMGSGVRA
jgi:pyridoxal phosphate enzyme (YggS family)